ncbi:Lipoprotein signal peptidase [Caloramator mitchellensis]|uniref:Lipoprotein signal peptidase n=1 Tax=Caloramator mitchellensis TaxID=908809 RepID=A0A0R3JZH5_CALMK|nr:signal peptidase II [Caloramator mitchellensis]KRQ86548.1 Lipoprotein signal peptidase [Caloramator mitchellensis]
MQLVFIALIFLIDQLTKILAKTKLLYSNGVNIINGVFEFVYVENRGAAFGILKNKKFFLVGVTTFVIGGMLYYLFTNKELNKWYRASLILIVAGAIGNLYDRVFRGYVIDFIHVYYKTFFDFPVFNIADISVVIGTFLLALTMLFTKE